MKLIEVPAGELAVRFRGWKLPPELGETIGPDRHGVNPFTKEKVLFLGRRTPLGPVPIADRDAVHHPGVDDLDGIPLPDEIYDETLDDLAMVVFGWSPRYALGEISDRRLEGGDDRNDWFRLVPRRVVDALAALPEDALTSTAERWSERYDLPFDVAATWLPRIRAFCQRVSVDALVLLWGTR